MPSREAREQRFREAGWRRSVAAILFALMLLPTTVGLVRSQGSERGVLELGWSGVVRQSRPNFCGPAVIATLLGWNGQATSDAAVAAKAELQVGGVSLAEFERLAGDFGLRGRWFTVPGWVPSVSLPRHSVVHLRGKAGHFAILERVVNGYFQLADPARGRVLVPAEHFEREWTGLVFLFEFTSGSTLSTS